MDVRMPDGTIVTNVPDNITQSELLSRYQSYQPPEGGLASLQSTIAPTSNPLLGLVSRAGSLVGAGIEGIARLAEKAGDKLETAIPLSGLTTEQITKERQLEPLFQFAESTKNWARGINYEPSTKLSDLASNPLTVIPFIAERIISSSPDMAAAVVAMPAYVTARTNEILNDRLRNDEKTLDDATVKDVTMALGGAVFEATLERGATKALLKGKPISGASSKARIAKVLGYQSGTEAAEEGVSYLAGTVDTKKGVDTKELLENMAEGAIVGGGLGGSVQGTKEYLDYRNKKKEAAESILKEEESGAPPADEIVPPDTVKDAVVPPSGAIDTATMIAEFGGEQLPLTPPAPSRFNYEVTNTPAYEGFDPLTPKDADFELEVLEERAKRNRLTPEVFAQSEIGKRLGTPTIMSINEGLRNDPLGTIKALRQQVQQKASVTSSTAAPIEAAPVTPPIASPESKIVPLDDKGEPVSPKALAAPSSQLALAAPPVDPNPVVAPPEVIEPPLDPNVEAQLVAEPFDPDSIILPPKEVIPPPPPPAAKKPKAPKVAQVYYGKDAAGNTNVPVSEGGLPFTTKAEAEKIKALQPELRVQKVKGGWLLGEKSEQYKAADKLRVKNLTKIDTPGLIGDILRMGGLDPAFKSDLGFGEKENPSIGNRRLFAAPGKGVAPQTVTEMYMEDRPDEAEFTGQDIDFEQSLPERIKAELKRIQSGERIETPEQALERRQEEDALEYEAKQDERDRAAQIEAQDISTEVAAEQAVEAADLGNFRQQMLDAGYTEQDLNVIGFTKASPELQAEVAALEKQVTEAGLDAPGILESLSKTYGDRLITKQEYYEKAKTRLEQAIREKAIQGGGRDVSQVDVQEGAAREEGLVSPSEQELKAKQEAAEQAEAAKVKADRDTAAKDKADAERKEIAARSEKAADEFVLGQDAQQNLSGQKDILDIAEKADVPPVLQAPADFVLKEGRIEQVALAARALGAGKITKAEYDKYVDFYAPISTISNPEAPLSDAGMARVLKSNQVGKLNPDIKDGTRVGLRMDINALKRARALSKKTGENVVGSVVSIHEGSDSNKTGKVIGYSGAASIKNVKFSIRNEEDAFQIAQSIDDKSPQQTIEGNYVNVDPKEAYDRMIGLLKDPSWSQVSLDPLRHSFFYDRSNKQPVVAADEVIQVGRFVLAKNVTYAERDSFLYSIGKKNKEFKTLDGFTFYLTEDGRVVDNLDPDKVDMSWDTFDDFVTQTSYLRTIFPDQEVATSNSAEQIRKENIAKYASLKQKLSAIQRRFVKDKSKPFDKESYKYLTLQAQDLKDAIASTKEPKVSPADFLARAAKELAEGNISQEVYDVVDAMYKKNPNLLNGLRLSVKATETDASGQFFPLTKIVRLYKESEGVTNPSTIRHELTHSLEQMMDQDAQASLVDAWAKSLLKASKAAKTKEEKLFFAKVSEFIDNPTRDTMLAAVNAMPDYSFYQYITPSEFWAINAEPLMASYLGGGWQRFKSSVRGLLEALKDVFGFDNQSQIYKTFNSVINSNNKRASPMLVDFVDVVGNMIPIQSTQKTLPGIAGKPKKQTQIPVAKPKATWTNLPDMTRKDNWILRIFDKNYNLKLVQKAIEEASRVLKDNLNVYRKETLSHGRIDDQVNRFLIDELSPVITEMQNTNTSDDALTEYLVMRHAEERNDLVAKRNPNNQAMQDNGIGVTYKEREDYFKALSPERKKVFESLAKKVDDILKKTLDILEDGKVISKEERKGWEDMFKYYIPARREESDFLMPSSSYRRVGDFAKSIVGSSRKVVDVLSNVAVNRQIAINRVEKERIYRAFYGLTLMHPNPEYFITVSPDAVKNRDALAAEIQDQFGMTDVEAKEVVEYIMSEPNRRYFNKETGEVVSRTDTQAKYQDYVLPVKMDGKDRFIFFNPRNPRAMQMVQSLRGLDSQQLPRLLEIIAPVTRFFSAINTQYNLVFGVWNLGRDIQGAQINLSTTPIADRKKEVFNGTFKAMKDIFTALRERNAGKKYSDTSDGSYSDFVANGGKVGFQDQFQKVNDSSTIVARELAKLNRGNIKKATFATLNWISNVNDVLENAVRVSAYRAALNKFKSEAKTPPVGQDLEDMKARAADIAKNLTVNFNRKGTWGATAGSLFAFFNASAQGTARLYETLKGPTGKKIMAGGIALGMVQALALSMAGFDEDEPTEFIKQKNLIIPTGDGKYAMWPMPFGFNVFPNIGRILVEALSLTTQGKDASGKLYDTITMLGNAFNPLGGGGLLQMVSPTVLDPLVALTENRDAFGRPISRESRSSAPKPGYTLSRDPSPSISQYLAEFVNAVSFGNQDKRGWVSPTADQIDYLAAQVGGGVYREVSRAGKYAANLVEGKETPESQVPLAGKVVGNINSPQAISQRFYNNAKTMSEHEDAIKGRIGRRESTSQYMRENPEASLWRRANRLENDISKLNTRRRDLIKQSAPYERIKQIDDQKTRMMKQFNDDVKKREAAR